MMGATGTNNHPYARGHAFANTWKESRAGFLPRRLALGFHGHYVRDSPPERFCSDFFSTNANLDQTFRVPTEAAGCTLSIFFQTTRVCPSLDQRLVELLKPTRFEFAARPAARVVDSYIAVLQLILKEQRSHDAIILSRFDVLYSKPLDLMPIHWAHVNLAWRDIPGAWETKRSASDLFYALPMRHAAALVTALNASGNHARYYGPCPLPGLVPSPCTLRHPACPPTLYPPGTGLAMPSTRPLSA
jgi:hypothetical protein